MGSRALALALALVLLSPRPAGAQVVCLDCFTEILGENPFSSPLVLPGQLLLTGTLGLASPLATPAWLPGLAAKWGLQTGAELTATVGYEPSIGARVPLYAAGPLNVLGAARFGYDYFRHELLRGYATPVLLALPGLALRLEPQLTFNQLTGPHIALAIALARPLNPGTTASLVLQPDLALATQAYTGSLTVAVSHALNARLACYALGSIYDIQGLTPLVGAGFSCSYGP